MGAWIRVWENRIEREIEAGKSNGVPVPAANGHAPVSAPQSDATADWRRVVPPLGLREYWHVALPAKKVGRKPVFWVMLGQELVFFRDQQGGVVALSDVCPHRGASLSEGDCFFKGFVTCPYHGATFNAEGECVAFLTEGPDSRMVGNLNVRSLPTRTLKGWVFVWMGEGEPVPIEEDVPPDFFEPETLVLSTYTYWRCNWMIALENQGDAHNQFLVHRNSLMQLLEGRGGRGRTPAAASLKLVPGKAVMTQSGAREDYYAEKNGGPAPYQMYYPGVSGVWPLHRWRRLWGWFFRRFVFRPKPFATPEDWRGGQHLPCMVRTREAGWRGMYTRYAVPVKENLSRLVYFHSSRPPNAWSRLWERAVFHTIYNWIVHYNFSGQDGTAAAPCRYWTPERLSATDARVVALRKLVIEQSRDARRGRALGQIVIPIQGAGDAGPIAGDDASPAAVSVADRGETP